MGFLKGFREGLGSDGTDRYSVAGRLVRCGHCGGESFDEGAAQLHTRWLTFLDLEWLNKDATVLVCRGCGHVEWFVGEAEAL